MTTDFEDQAISRREFIARAIKAGAAVAAVGAGGYLLHDRQGPPASSSEAGEFKLQDFSIPAQAGKMAIVTGSQRAQTVRAALDALGGIGMFIKKGDRVMLKVNAAFATPPALSATTHPDLVKALTQLCLGAEATSVVVTDNPINDAASCFELTGIAEAARSAGAKVVIPRDRSFLPITVPGGKLIVRWPFLAEPFAGVNKIIGVAPVKHHERSGASMIMKNWYGLLGGRRNTFHQDIHAVIMELAMMVSPTLVVLDGTAAMMRNGPTGGSLDDLAATNTMIVSTDQVAADAFGATLLGRTVADLPYIAKAATAGRGAADWQSLRLFRADAR